MNNDVVLVFETVMPLFCIALIGYLATKLKYFSTQANDGLSKFVFDIAVPLMFLQVFATAESPQERPLLLIAAYYIPVYIVYGLGMLLARRREPGGFRTQVMSGYVAASGNIVLVGLPLIGGILGEEAYLSFMIIASVHPILLLTLSLLLMEMGGQKTNTWPEAAKTLAMGIVRNPMIIAMFAGITLNILDLQLPQFIDQTGRLMRLALTPSALFVLGAALATFHISGNLKGAMALVAMKGLLLPLLVGLFAFIWFDLDRLSAAVLVLMAAQPSALMSYVISRRYEVEQSSTATAILLSSLLTVLSMGVLTYVFHTAGIGAG